MFVPPPLLSGAGIAHPKIFQNFSSSRFRACVRLSVHPWYFRDVWKHVDVDKLSL